MDLNVLKQGETDSTKQRTKVSGRLTSPRLKLGLSFFTFILVGANDGAVGVLLPSIMKQYAVNESTIGLLFLASTCGYLIASFNVGTLMEKFGSWQTLLLGIVLFLLGTGTLILQPPFTILPAAYFFIGMGVAIIDPGLNIYIASLPQNTALLNYLHGFYGIGALLGPIIASALLALSFGWNSIYVFWFAVALLLLASFSIIFRDWRQTQASDGEKGQKSTLSIILRSRYVWIAAIFMLFYVGGEVTLGNWSYSLLTQDRHGLALISGWIVSGYWLGLTLGRLLLGSVAKQIGDKRMIQFCLLGTVVGLVITWVAPVAAISAIGLFITGFSLGPIFPTTIAVTSRTLPSRILASSIGFIVSLGSMGAAFFPWIMGNLAQHIGLWSLLPFCILIALTQLGLWRALQE
ncbi:MAG TPA: MFS transporter [Ktedonobacteraceae bacterium]|nr:MFS transporter [Ktedonobacteraceae bacterium]